MSNCQQLKACLLAAYAHFWEDKDLVLRDIIALNDSYTLRPANEARCEEHKVNCQLKDIDGMDLKMDTQGCNDGWRIDLKNLGVTKRAMIQCTGDGTVNKAEARWQFLVYSTGNIYVCFTSVISHDIWLNYRKEI